MLSTRRTSSAHSCHMTPTDVKRNLLGEPPVLFTEDPHLRESILRLAAVADVDVMVQSRVSEARGRWSSASVVLIGSDALSDALIAGVPRRGGVVIIRLDDSDVWEPAVRIGAEDVVTLPVEESALIARLVNRNRAADASSPVVVISGGSGGAGASHLATAVARAGATRVPRGVLLIDGDRIGGGIELLVEVESAPGLRWRDLATTRGRISPDALREALPSMGGVHVLSHDREATVVDDHAWESILDAGTQGFDLTVVDSARDTSVGVCDRAQLNVIVVPADLRSVAAAAARSVALRGHAGQVLIAVRHRRDSDLDSADIAAALELPILGEYADAKPVSTERVAESILSWLDTGGMTHRGRRRTGSHRIRREVA